MMKAKKGGQGSLAAARAAAMFGALAAIAASSTAANAQGDWYARASAGLVFLSDDDRATFTNPTNGGNGAQTADLAFGNGSGIGGAVGRWFGDRWRGDVEFMYRSSDIDSATFGDGSSADGDNYASTALSVNGYYHFTDPGAVGAFSPYVGAGLAWFTEIDMDLTGGNLAGAPYEDLEDDGIGFQIMGGVSWRQTERLSWDAELRWTSFGTANLRGDDGISLTGVDYDPLTLAIGVSYRF